MKKYLFITPWCPFPPHKNGGVHTIYNILKNKINVEVDLLYYFEKDSDSEYETINQGLVSNVKFVDLRNDDSMLSRIKSLIIMQPDLVGQVNHVNLNTFINLNLYDVVILDQIYSLPFAVFIPDKIKIISMLHDNMSLMYSRKKTVETSIFKKIYNDFQCKYYHRIENKFFSRLSRIVFVSELDANLCKKDHPKYKNIITNMTLGADVADKKDISTLKVNNSIVFSGVMSYGPNEDAAYYFATKLFPSIKKHCPDCIFYIVGKEPSERIKNLETDIPGIVVTGYVDNMVTTITKASIYISPLRFGSGTKNKVLEAMAAGMPIVLSPVSREGIDDLEDGVNCIFADTDEAWTIKILQLFNDDEKLQSLGMRAQEFIISKHSWSKSFYNFTI